MLQILLSFAIINFKRRCSSHFVYLRVLVFQPCFISVLYHVNFVLHGLCVYFIMADYRSKVQVRTWEKVLLLNNILIKLKMQCVTREYYPFTP